MNRFDRRLIKTYPYSERDSKLDIEKIAVYPDAEAQPLDDSLQKQIARLAKKIKAARKKDKPVIMAYGAHLVKNGLAPIVTSLMEDGWITHLATNGAGSIHDWEFAFGGKSSEDVRKNTAEGKFGTCEETGKYINLAVAVGVLDNFGYGWSVGKMIAEDGLIIPSDENLKKQLAEVASMEKPGVNLGALADLLFLITNRAVPAGKMAVKHPYKQLSLQYHAYRLGIPLTVHPGIGYDIIYTHPMNSGGAIGRAAVRDFLTYAGSVSHLDGGVHIGVGSAVMAPMIFEKSMSMANNLSISTTGKPLTKHYMAVVDIQDGGGWDWTKDEPPMDNPAYYLRFCKSFHRMGGTLDYISLDNREFLLHLNRLLS